MLSVSHPPTRSAQRLALVTVTLSLLLFGALVAVYLLSKSQLALAQAADSLADTLTQSALAASLWIARRPPDDDHHFGHRRAEPIAALVAAVMVGVVAVEVLREAVGAILSNAEPVMHWSLALVFVLKTVIKLGIAYACRRVNVRDGHNPVVQAIFVDARNDAALGGVALIGYFAAKNGSPAWDAYLAIPVGLWIGWSAIDLARDTMPLLMGGAPSEERQRELLELSGAVEGVREVHGLRVQHAGIELDVFLHVAVDPDLSLQEAHDIGQAVEMLLAHQKDVARVMVHVDPDDRMNSRLAPKRQSADQSSD